MDDLDALKAIKDKENDVSLSVTEMKSQKEAELKALEESLRNSLLETEKKLSEERERKIEESRKEAEEEASRILENARIKVSRMKLMISDDDLVALFDRLLKEYTGVK